MALDGRELFLLIGLFFVSVCVFAFSIMVTRDLSNVKYNKQNKCINFILFFLHALRNWSGLLFYSFIVVMIGWFVLNCVFPFICEAVQLLDKIGILLPFLILSGFSVLGTWYVWTRQKEKEEQGAE